MISILQKSKGYHIKTEHTHSGIQPESCVNRLVIFRYPLRSLFQIVAIAPILACIQKIEREFCRHQKIQKIPKRSFRVSFLYSVEFSVESLPTMFEDIKNAFTSWWNLHTQYRLRPVIYEPRLNSLVLHGLLLVAVVQSNSGQRGLGPRGSRRRSVLIADRSYSRPGTCIHLVLVCIESVSIVLQGVTNAVSTVAYTNRYSILSSP